MIVSSSGSHQRPFLLAVAAATFVTMTGEAVAQGRALHAAQRTEPIVLDGLLDEKAWTTPEAARDFVQSDPREGQPATERTEVRVLFDADYLYVGAWCFDREPSGIMANSLRPDFPATEEDTFEVLLDTFADSRGGFLFVTNPKGARRDVQVSSEGAVQNEDWDAVWEVATRTTAEGWFVEMRIPFNSLRYYSPITKPWHVNFGRRIRRHNEFTYWSPIPRRYDISRVSLAGDLTGLEQEPLNPAHNLWFKPYVTGRTGASNGAALSSSGDVGGDAKFAVTNGLTLDLTVNADFAQVEVDNQVINLDRFSLFFPEKREFFLENQGIFQVGTMGKAPSSLDPEDVAIFYSRRIGLSENRNPVPIIGGARLTGRAGAYQVGALNLETGRGDGQGRENASAFRVKRDIGARSEIGGFFLNRQGSERLTNQTFGFDAVLRPRRELLFNIVHARTRTPDAAKDGGSLTRVEMEYDSRPLRMFLVHSDVGDGYRNDLGFVKKSGVEVSRLEVLPRIRPWRGGFVREINPGYNVRYMTDQRGLVLLRKHTAEVGVVFRDGGSFKLSRRHYFDLLQDDFHIQKDVVVPRGAYHYDDWTGVLMTDPSRMFSSNVTLAHGNFWDGEKTTRQVGVRFRPNARLGTELTFARDDVDLRGGSFTATVSRLRVGYAVNTRAFLDAFVQYNSQDKRVSSNVRFNFIHRPLSDIFVVYTEERPTLSSLHTNKMLSVKYTHLLTF